MHCSTLRRTLNKAKDDVLIFDAPDFTLFKEKGRSLRPNKEAERSLLQVADQPLKEIVVSMRDEHAQRTGVSHTCGGCRIDHGP